MVEVGRIPLIHQRTCRDPLSRSGPDTSSSEDTLVRDASSLRQPTANNSLGLSLTELPPPYSAVAREMRSAHRRGGLSSTEQSDAGQDTASISSMDLLASEDEFSGYNGRLSRMKRFRSTPQLSRVSRTLNGTAREEGAHTPRHTSCRSPNGSMSPSAKTNEQLEQLEPLPRAFELLLHSLSLFAVVPGLAGTLLLLHHAYQEANQRHWLRTDYVFQRPSALEYIACSLWSMTTAFHALSLMTLLLRRWLIYYTLLPSLIRLVTFQSICWSLVRLILHLFGPIQPVAPWVLIATFTSFFEIFARWLTSSINDGDIASHRRGTPHLDHNETGMSDMDGHLTVDHDDFESAPQPWLWQLNRQARFRMYREQSVRLVRAFMGGPDGVHTSDSEWEPSDKNAMSSSDRLPDNDSTFSLMEMERWRRRVDERRQWKHRSRTRRRPKRFRISAFFQNYHAAHIRSRRVFHWEVAMWRNVMPIGVLGYLSLWVLLLEFTVTRYVQGT